MNELSRREKAMDYFTQGYNCAQSIALTFADYTGLDEKTITKLASSFGGGMGRLREVCGAVTGMFMILGLIYGYDDPECVDEKAELYGRVQETAGRFEKENGSIICRRLLGLGTEKDGPVPYARNKEYYETRPCKELVGSAAEILEEYILKNRIE